MIISSKRLSPAGAQVGCIRNTSFPLTFSWMLILISPSLKVSTFACPSLVPSSLEIASDRALLPFPEKRTSPFLCEDIIL